MTTLETLLRHAPPACSCAHCQQMCMCACTPTPEDARRLIEGGHGARLMRCVWSHDPLVYFLTPALKGSEGTDSPATPVSMGGCTFWNRRRLCDLHDAGLKPTEGRLTHHHPKHQWGKKLVRLIIAAWDTDDGRALVQAWMDEYYAPPPVRARVETLERYQDWIT